MPRGHMRTRPPRGAELGGRAPRIHNPDSSPVSPGFMFTVSVSPFFPVFTALPLWKGYSEG